MDFYTRICPLVVLKLSWRSSGTLALLFRTKVLSHTDLSSRGIETLLDNRGTLGLHARTNGLSHTDLSSCGIEYLLENQ